MNWLKDLINKTYLARAKAPLLREIDRAVAKLRSGETAATVVPALELGFSRALAGWLPSAVAMLLLPLVLGNVDWLGLVTMTTNELASFLSGLRTKVEGARL
jgi:hypothetical protein